MPECNYSFYRLLSLTSLLLAACSAHMPFGPVKRHDLLKWRSHQQLISTLSNYQMRGAFAYLSKKQKVYAYFNWQQISFDSYRLILFNPLGNTEMDLNVQSGVVRLVNNEGKHYISDDPEVIIQKLTGMYIPLNNLRQWILGLPGDATDFTLDTRGYLHQVRYGYTGQRWTVTYRGYYEDTMPALPSNLELYQNDNCIKLKIDSWSF